MFAAMACLGQTYDYNFQATVFADGQFFGTRYTNETVHPYTLNSYYTVLSDKPLSEDYEDGLMPGGTYYAFQIMGAAPANMRHILPPDGTYKYSDTVAMNVLLSNAHIYVLDGNGNYEVDRAVTGGKLVLTTTEKDSSSYLNYDLVLTDNLGKTHHVTYTSRFVEYTDKSQVAKRLEKDLDFTAKSAQGKFKELDKNGVMQMQLYFSSLALDEDGDYDASELPGSFIYLQTYLNYTPEGIANGEYDITPNFGAPFTMADGEIKTQWGIEWAVGSYVEYVHYGSTLHWGVFKSGKLIVSGEGDSRTYTAQFVTEEGFLVKFTYTGALQLKKMPESSLTEDVTLNLTNATCTASYIGNTYDSQLATWILRFKSADGKQQWQTELASKDPNYKNGIKSATYTMAPNNNLWGNDYLRGQRVKGALVGTWYMSGFDAEGTPHILAPSEGGDLKIDNQGDGIYEIQFSFNDGMAHTWSGQWIGSPEIIDDSGVGSAYAEPSITRNGDSVTITLPSTSRYDIYDVAGRKLESGESDVITISGRGIYLVRIDGKTLKVRI